MANGAVPGVYKQVARVFRDGTLTPLSDRELLDRYLKDHDERAFELILGRHGGMVVNVCRRVLHYPQDVEDAYQAVFLALIHKAGSLRIKDSLGPWLYRVANRAATRTRSNRRRAEALAQRKQSNSPTGPQASECEQGEITTTLRQELDKLPARLRSPLVLCYLEGMTHELAARQLGCPVGTVRSRMARARAILESRLSRRGLSPSATPLYVALGAIRPATGEVSARVTRSLISVAIQSASASTKSWETFGISASVTALMEGVLFMMRITKAALVVTSLVSAGSLAGVAAVGVLSAADEPQVSSSARPPEKPPERKPSQVAKPSARIVKTYYIGDLIAPTARPYPPAASKQDQPEPKEKSSTTQTAAEPALTSPRPEADMRYVIDLIAKNVQPGTWQILDKQGKDISANYVRPGGPAPPANPIGAITPFPLTISLIIRQTKEGHDQVASLLRSVRRVVQARENPGVDLDREGEKLPGGDQTAPNIGTKPVGEPTPISTQPSLSQTTISPAEYTPDGLNISKIRMPHYVVVKPREGPMKTSGTFAQPLAPPKPGR